MRVWEEIISIRVLLETPFSLETPRFSLQTPRFSLETPRFSLETPRFSLETNRFSLETPRFSLETPRFSLETPSFSLKTPYQFVVCSFKLIRFKNSNIQGHQQIMVKLILSCLRYNPLNGIFNNLAQNRNKSTGAGNHKYQETD